MEFQSVQHSIDRLIQWIRTSRLALPDFQRDFVWSPSRVVELLDSVARQWPIGSLLLLSGPQKFGTKPIQDAPSLRGRDLDYYVLDGQQRLTALYHAIIDVSEFCYYVDFRALANDEDDYILWERRPAFLNRYPDLRSRASAGIALIREVWDLDVFYTWLSGIRETALQKKFVSLREQRLGGLTSKVYKVMAIELDQQIEIEALARIFETLNRTGVRLNAFDLMVAMLYPTGFHLRDKWQEAQTENDLTSLFEVDAVEVLKLTALLIRQSKGRSASRGVRQGDLLDIDPPLITRFWDSGVELYERALNEARDSFGVCCSDVVPSWGMILGLAAWYVRGDKRRDSKAVRNWFWGTVFAQTYAQAANTTIVSDFDQIAEGNGPGLSKQRIAIDFPILDEPAKRNGLALRGLACLLTSIGGKDPVSGELLGDLSEIVPRALEPSGKVRLLSSAHGFDRVIFMSPESARKLAKQYAKAVSEIEPDRQFKERLSTQLIGAGFVRELDRIRQFIKTGAKD
jgi:hypothetical protein